VRSSVIRLAKMALQQQGISLHAPPTQVEFTREIPASVVLHRASEAGARPAKDFPPPRQPPSEEVATQAEAGLYSEAGVIEQQARHVAPLQENENLLQPDSAPPGKHSSP